ncbi:hypothetical protein EJP82_01320 [Paenibacillus anaericanus]|uniref:Uncharacterized protein n=1 Tax=Paenibacillus anaericanus TaxID=170367 RepID=A0A3S1DTB6_9BACL|nr:hypothetical protein [Paenibacillus anaericanus]RUT48609.1 hypothetical protein EJP82_01320 [Paenibacillus anaericanus]
MKTMYELITDERKRRWLKRHGYKPLTDDVIQELLRDEAKPWYMDFDRLKQTFQFYRRYGKMIMPYSIRYLNQRPLEELKFRHYRNIKWHTELGRVYSKFKRSFIGRCLTDPWIWLAIMTYTWILTIVFK